MLFLIDLNLLIIMKLTKWYNAASVIFYAIRVYEMDRIAENETQTNNVRSISIVPYETKPG